MNKKLGLGTVMLLGLLIAFFLMPIVLELDPMATNVTNRFGSPGPGAWLGTDHLGRDLLARLIYGGRLTVGLTLGALLTALVTGGLVGLLSGYFGGVWDAILSYVLELFLAFPNMVLSLLIVALLGGGIENTFIAVSLVAWVPYARMVRGAVLSLKQQDFIKGARLAGSGHFAILFRHIVPNVLDTLAIFSGTNFGFIMLQFAGLSFLGLGASLEVAEWGAMLQNYLGHMQVAPRLVLAPALALAYTAAAFALLGEGLAETAKEKWQG